MVIQLGFKVKERIPGSWSVTDYELKTYDVELWTHGLWRCPCRDGWQVTGGHCPHVGAVLVHDQVTRCADLDGCRGISCGSWRVDGAPTPLCPQHASEMARQHQQGVKAPANTAKVSRCRSQQRGARGDVE